MSIYAGKASFERICIVGPGAMGLLHAACLAQAGLRVSLLDHRPERAARLTRSGFTLETDEGAWPLTVPCLSEAQGEPPDLLLFFVKAYATADAVSHAAPLIGPETVLLTLQNGLGNLETLQMAQRPELVLAGTTSTGATLVSEGHVRLAGLGQVELGSLVGNRDLAERVAALFTQAGLPATVTAAVQSALWRKAIVNSAINPLTALTGLTNGELLEQEDLRALLIAVTEEAAQVAVALGLPGKWSDLPRLAEEICRATAHNRSSMLQDVLAGRQTEIEQITGVLVARGHELGLPLPHHETLLALLRGRTFSPNQGDPS